MRSTKKKDPKCSGEFKPKTKSELSDSKHSDSSSSILPIDIENQGFWKRRRPPYSEFPIELQVYLIVFSVTIFFIFPFEILDTSVLFLIYGLGFCLISDPQPKFTSSRTWFE